MKFQIQQEDLTLRIQQLHSIIHSHQAVDVSNHTCESKYVLADLERLKTDVMATFANLKDTKDAFESKLRVLGGKYDEHMEQVSRLKRETAKSYVFT
jgi:hypothetical protein